MAYRELMEMEQVYPDKAEKPVKISLCFVDGFTSLYGAWSTAHDVLMSKLVKDLGTEIRVYLVQPAKPEYAAEEHWFCPEKYAVSAQVKIYGK